MKYLFALVILILLWFAWANGAMAQQQLPCGERANFVTNLADKYDEHPISMALVMGGSLAEIFASSHGSWTLLITTPEGMTCMYLSGTAWELFEQLYMEGEQS